MSGPCLGAGGYMSVAIEIKKKNKNSEWGVG